MSTNVGTKYFLIGLHKTGTTSIEHLFKKWGYVVGDQSRGERLLHDWYIRRFDRIISLVKTADFFQDTPFSLPYTYVVLDQYFPNAKFILTIRDSADQWYQSLVRFHSKIWSPSNAGLAPTSDDLRSATYGYFGRAYHSNRMIFSSPETELYKRSELIKYYESHNYQVEQYFKHSYDRFIKINLNTQSDYGRLEEFCGRAISNGDFEVLNSSK